MPSTMSRENYLEMFLVWLTRKLDIISIIQSKISPIFYLVQDLGGLVLIQDWGIALFYARFGILGSKTLKLTKNRIKNQLHVSFHENSTLNDLQNSFMRQPCLAIDFLFYIMLFDDIMIDIN